MAPREKLTAQLRPLVERMHVGHCWKKTQDGPRMIGVPFTEVMLSEHVMGGAAYGLCPIAPGESTCRVACLDLDSHQGEISLDAMKRTASDICTILDAMYGLKPHAFTSSGGRGVHIYLVWAESQDAYSVRETLRAALNDLNLKPGTKGVAKGEVEIFPKQSEVPNDGYGSMFILPWSGASAPFGGFHTWVDSAPVLVRAREERSAHGVAAEVLPALRRVRSALDAIPNSGAAELGYDEWRDIVFAVHHATGGSDEGLELVHAFSARAGKYDSDFLNNRVWPYVRSERDGPTITEGTLYAAASTQGWQDPTTQDDFDAVEVPDHSDARAPGDASSARADVRFTFIPEKEFASQAPTDWLIVDVLPDADLVVVYGESGSGKSFWTLDLLQAVARGVPWCGKRVVQGRSAYIAAEGAGGFRKRLTAYKHEHELDTTDLFVLPDAPSFLEAAHVKDVIKRLREIGPVKVVVIDTAAQVMPGGAENSSEDMGKLIMHCRMVRKHTGAMVILIHHSGKDAAKGARGWSGLRGAVDTEIEIIRAEHDRVATITKQKDGEDGQEFGFKLRQVRIGENEHGDHITSCVVDHGAAVAKDRRRQGPKGEIEKAVWQAVLDLVALDGSTPTTGEVIDIAVTRMLYDPAEGKRDLRRQHALRALSTLAGRGTILVEGERIRVPGHAQELGNDLQGYTNT